MSSAASRGASSRFRVLFLSAAGFSGIVGAWESVLPACADSASWAGERDFWFEAPLESGHPEECDPEESLLFSREPVPSRARESNRASLALTRAPGGEARSVVRSQAVREGWTHRVEMRGDTLARRQLGWEGHGWRVVAGDLADTAMPVWPRALPRRALPTGWRPARGLPEDWAELSSPLPQGLALGVVQPAWRGYALRAWNPVESGREPPWHDAWDMRHTAGGGALTPTPGGWTGSLHFSDTRVTREGVDSVSEQLVAAGLASPRRGAVLTGMLSESRRTQGAGWLLAADLRHAVRGGNARGASVDLTLRQRDGDWASSWDPAWSRAAAERDTVDRDWGAGEARLAGRLPFRRPDVRREQGFVRGETWRAWNPAAGTSRQGVRGTFAWREEDARIEFSGTHRTSRAASGSVSLYRHLQADTRMESPPRWRVTAWRAWNRDGPLRSGMFVGAEPSFGQWMLRPGLRLEVDRHDALGGLASLGLRYGRGSGWRLDGYGTLPVWPAVDAESMRWRVTLHYSGR